MVNHLLFRWPSLIAAPICWHRNSDNKAAAGMHELKLKVGITTSEGIDRHRLGTKSKNSPKDKDSQRRHLLRHHRLRSQEEV